MIDGVVKTKSPFMRDVLAEVVNELDLFRERFARYAIEIKHLGQSKKHNMFHRAAHNAARTVIKISR
jgi:hypothetical protein